MADTRIPATHVRLSCGAVAYQAPEEAAVGAAKRAAAGGDGDDVAAPEGFFLACRRRRKKCDRCPWLHAYRQSFAPVGEQRLASPSPNDNSIDRSLSPRRMREQARAGEVWTSPVPRALTVYQPWATLIAARKKTIEVRRRRTWYRGTLLIHAGRQTEPWYDGRPLPSGCVVAVVELIDCRRLGPDDIPHYFGYEIPDQDEHRQELEWLAGPGQDWWGWVLRWRAPLPEVPMRGRQGLWVPSARELAQLAAGAVLAGAERAL